MIPGGRIRDDRLSDRPQLRHCQPGVDARVKVDLITDTPLYDPDSMCSMVTDQIREDAL